MRKRIALNCIAVLIVALLWGLMLTLHGCTSPGVKMTVKIDNPKCGLKEIDFSTGYNIKNLYVTRGIEGGGTSGENIDEGCGGFYTIKMDEATPNENKAMWEFLTASQNNLINALSLVPGSGISAVQQPVILKPTSATVPE